MRSSRLRIMVSTWANCACISVTSSSSLRAWASSSQSFLCASRSVPSCNCRSLYMPWLSSACCLRSSIACRRAAFSSRRFLLFRQSFVRILPLLSYRFQAGFRRRGAASVPRFLSTFPLRHRAGCRQPEFVERALVLEFELFTLGFEAFNLPLRGSVTRSAMALRRRSALSCCSRIDVRCCSSCCISLRSCSASRFEASTWLRRFCFGILLGLFYKAVEILVYRFVERFGKMRCWVCGSTLRFRKSGNAWLNTATAPS